MCHTMIMVDSTCTWVNFDLFKLHKWFWSHDHKKCLNKHDKNHKMRGGGEINGVVKICLQENLISCLRGCFNAGDLW